jgi:hypothetical protein
MAQEIVYSETTPGVFEPMPSPARKRHAKRKLNAQKKRRRKAAEAELEAPIDPFRYHPDLIVAGAIPAVLLIVFLLRAIFE